MDIASRIKALAYIIEGLSQHVLRDYPKALSAYASAMAVPDWSDQDGPGHQSHQLADHSGKPRVSCGHRDRSGRYGSYDSYTNQS